ncbi:homospermidine synthase [Cupriavidus taiwanensis]|uniref:Homospermidine synthase (HSS) n=1 Tax=Cupriavidus taiwanensis TaxID=164546 RepID=A0A7Z7J7S8_9BURK|nr:saccharopine dehydrogenase NADP-binding domain-containing protein [Cupriavidus taiwanensis]SOY44614.1 Homospermidine synthase (HSS) [Cupriavidus taiwanensis]SOY87558.1 Homospermidine synthase (HSS) [Cupriavidus taiwanensis]SOZ05462.1 Homospermidine synthase (HSS) [Cupriavidus taiwanensis]SOZ07447.1 Homospermidine synthase (HSS) [Cupriavidus taiwanensis]SPC15487.1 Homospermidine synthase (HSS) [Cupriavidus taiwanensis]
MDSPATTFKKFGGLRGRMVIVGFGSIARSVVPVLLRHLDITPAQITVVCPPSNDTAVAQEYGIRVVPKGLTEENHKQVLQELVGEGDFLLNLSVNVSSEALVRYCWEHGVLYLDTSIEPWAGAATDPAAPLSRRSNYALREGVLAFRLDKRDGPTAILTQGANPGLVSALVKQALVNIAADNDVEHERPASFEDWAALARQLDIRTIHIAEQDTQIGDRRKAANEFINTWSVDAFIEEGMQPAELGWGTHERHWPADARRHGFGSDAAVYLTRPGFGTRVRSWTPLGGPYHGFLITHGESISIADHLTLRDSGEVVYRPTVHYAYRPCDDALLSIDELMGSGRKQDHQRILRDDIVAGMDELGVLLMGNARGVYWYGSRLTIDQARQLVEHNTATSLQVVAGILGGVVWALDNPRAGVVEPDDLDYETVLRVARPYLGELVGVYGDWTPLAQHSQLYPPARDEDPWQFLNVRVT